MPEADQGQKTLAVPSNNEIRSAISSIAVLIHRLADIDRVEDVAQSPLFTEVNIAIAIISAVVAHSVDAQF